MNARSYTLAFVLAGIGITAGPAGADPPLNPLRPAPWFSFDLQSPSVQSGLVLASSVLALDPTHQAYEVIPGPALGLTSPADDLDGLSRLMSPPGGASFVFLFSVDRQTEGVAAPDPEFFIAGLPFNVADQAARGHAAGDEFVALQQYRSRGPIGRARALNSVLIRNNYDEGGEDFAAQPPTSSQDDLNRTAQDNVDAIVRLPTAGPPSLYFSTTRGSPSNLELPGLDFPSGANIFFNPDAMNGAPTLLYAPFYELGLQQLDDIDSLIVFEMNGMPVTFGPGDRIVFSLTPDSPALLTLPGFELPGAAAHVFMKIYGQPIMPLALAPDWGLGAPTDNVDALDLAPCADVQLCATEWGIRAHRGDLNCDNDVGFGDINAFVLALSNPSAYEALYPSCPWPNRDINGDQLFNFGDINPFVALLSGGP